MDNLTTILKELTEKGYKNIETYFNDSEELVLDTEAIDGSIVITVNIDKTFDIGVFNYVNKSEDFKHGVDAFEIRKEILRA